MKRRSRRMARKWWAYLRYLPEDSHVSDKLVMYTARIVGLGYDTRYAPYACKPQCTPQSLQHLK